MLKRYLNHVIFRLIGTTTFTRLIEWRFVFKLLNPQKGGGTKYAILPVEEEH